MSAATDRARASDGATVRVLTKADAIAQARDLGAFVLEGRARVQKYAVADGVVAAEPYEVITSEPNLFLTAGITNLWNLAVGEGAPTGWTTSTAYLAVGDSTAPADAAQTDLQGTNLRKLVDATGGIVVSGNAVTFTATYGTGDANFAAGWNEVGVVNAATGGIMLNRLQQAFGVKTSSAQWILQLTLSIS